MALCRYCGERIGWWSGWVNSFAHEACITSAQQGCEQVASLIASTMIDKVIPTTDHPDDQDWSKLFAQQLWSSVKPELDKIADQYRVPTDDMRVALRKGWSKGAEQVATAEPLSEDKLAVINGVYRAMGLTDQEMKLTDGFVASCFSTLLWSVMVHGDPKAVANVPRHPFNLKADEVALFFFGSTLFIPRRQSAGRIKVGMED